MAERTNATVLKISSRRPSHQPGSATSLVRWGSCPPSQPQPAPVILDLWDGLWDGWAVRQRAVASGEVDERLIVAALGLHDRRDVRRASWSLVVEAGRFAAPGQEGPSDRVAVQVRDQAGAAAVAVRERVYAHETEMDPN